MYFLEATLVVVKGTPKGTPVRLPQAQLFWVPQKWYFGFPLVSLSKPQNSLGIPLTRKQQVPTSPPSGFPLKPTKPSWYKKATAFDFAPFRCGHPGPSEDPAGLR